MRFFSCMIAAILTSAATFAQVPDVAPFLELHPSWQVRSSNKSLFQWYDPMGRYSLVGLRMILEPGYRVYVAQRFQRVENSGDPDTMDEYYIESRGHWRVGKQYLPFGRREIIKSTVPAIRGDANIFNDLIPVSVAACDGGSGRTRAIFARAGGPFGLSIAIGNHIANQPTDLSKFQFLEDASGIEHGYRLAFGGDALFSLGSAQITGEWVSLRKGELATDVDRDLSDIRLRFKIPGTMHRANFGWSRDWRDHNDYLIYELELKDTPKISYIPMLRMDGWSFHDFGLSAMIRL